MTIRKLLALYQHYKNNYDFRLQKLTYYELENLSDDITPTRNEIKITNVVFE